jgi:hypothetical protein
MPGVAIIPLGKIDLDNPTKEGREGNESGE